MSTHIEWQNNVPENFEADADPEQLFRVLMNLCRNSVQAMSDPDEAQQTHQLMVSAERQKNEVHIRVTDTGPGIADHVREKFFHAFQGSTKSGGTGLGMTIAGELVRAHGGSIRIEKTSSAGTIMHIIFPDTPDNTIDTQLPSR